MSISILPDSNLSEGSDRWVSVSENILEITWKIASNLTKLNPSDLPSEWTPLSANAAYRIFVETKPNVWFIKLEGLGQGTDYHVRIKQDWTLDRARDGKNNSWKNENWVISWDNIDLLSTALQTIEEMVNGEVR